MEPRQHQDPQPEGTATSDSVRVATGGAVLWLSRTTIRITKFEHRLGAVDHLLLFSIGLIVAASWSLRVLPLAHLEWVTELRHRLHDVADLIAVAYVSLRLALWAFKKIHAAAVGRVI